MIFGESGFLHRDAPSAAVLERIKLPEASTFSTGLIGEAVGKLIKALTGNRDLLPAKKTSDSFHEPGSLLGAMRAGAANSGYRNLDICDQSMELGRVLVSVGTDFPSRALCLADETRRQIRPLGLKTGQY